MRRALETKQRRAVRTEPPTLPEALLGESPLVKFLWAWLLPLGEVRLSTREVGALTGLSQPAVASALSRLKNIGLLTYLEASRGSAPPTLRANVAPSVP